MLPEKVKLTKAGESVTLHVTQCAPATVGTYPEIEFVGTANGKTVLVPVPRQSADRQLGRIPMGYQGCIGATLTISRDKNDKDASKPYWGITVGGNGKPEHPHHTSEEAQAAYYAGPPSNGKKTGAALYLELTRFALEKVVPLYEAKEIVTTMEGVGAIVATLYIQANKH